MNIFIDESGSFAPAERPGAWNCVAGYVSPEDNDDSLVGALARLKLDLGVSDPNIEVKLADLPEGAYLAFLNDLAALDGVVFAVASDAGVQTRGEIRKHQRVQGDLIESNIDRMVFESARNDLVKFADRIRNISPQLYVQLFCHTYLIHSVIARGVTYFAQRFPERLGSFQWRVDQKDLLNNVFHETYLMLALPLLQSMSIAMPFPFLEGADYSHYERFKFPRGEAPTFLQDYYGIEAGSSELFDLRKLLREDFQFGDSRESQGIQVADLISSGIRRCLRGGFSDNDSAARLLGALMVQDRTPQPPLSLIGFGPGYGFRTDTTAGNAALVMRRSCRPLLSPTWQPMAHG